MGGFHDGPYKLQDAISAYLTANLATYNSAVAAAVPHVLGGDFGDRSRDHIYIVAPTFREAPDLTGNYLADLIVGVATVKETTLATHREYVKAVFDLMEDTDLAVYVNALSGSKIRINQQHGGAEQAIGAITDSLRFSEIRQKFLVYQIT